MRPAEWCRKNHLKDCDTLSGHCHDDVDRVRKVEKPFNLKVYNNKNYFDHKIDKMLFLKNDSDCLFWSWPFKSWTFTMSDQVFQLPLNKINCLNMNMDIRITTAILFPF